KALPPKHLVALAVVAILGLFLVADYLWASSRSAAPSIWPSRLDISTRPTASPPPSEKQTKGNTSTGSMDISATFADLPAPELQWKQMAEAPVPRLDGAAIQIKNLLFVFAGYGTINYVHSHVDIYNFSDNTWGGKFDMPKEMAHSHLGMVTDGRYIYVVTGQYGPQCRGPTARNFVLDTERKEWHDLPPLPVPRGMLQPHNFGEGGFM
uniref:Kelch repeat-containing protein n=1 Tax=Aegilops tauschii subsp. strangulata TaxID=200361 RepID=A0A453C9F3_AEGTS